MIRVVLTVGMALLVAACGGDPAAPTGVIEYELVAVNGVSVPTRIAALEGTPFRVIAERITVGPDDVTRSQQVRQYEDAPERTIDVRFDIRSVGGDSLRYVSPCPFNAFCAIPDRTGKRPDGVRIEMREEVQNGLTLTYSRLR